MTWRKIAAVTSRNIEDEYLTATAGPTSHSPPPIEVEAITAPGPMTRRRFRKPNGGGAGNSSTSHAGKAPCGGGCVKRVSVFRGLGKDRCFYHDESYRTTIKYAITPALIFAQVILTPDTLRQRCKKARS